MKSKNFTLMKNKIKAKKKKLKYSKPFTKDEYKKNADVGDYLVSAIFELRHKKASND
jgi:hypothetical protein